MYDREYVRSTDTLCLYRVNHVTAMRSVSAMMREEREVIVTGSRNVNDSLLLVPLEAHIYSARLRSQYPYQSERPIALTQWLLGH